MTNGDRPNALPPLLNVGFYNFVMTHKIVALVRSDSAPIKRLVQQLRHEGTRLIDATQGRRTRCVIFLDSGQVVLSALSQETLAKRLSRVETAFHEDERELMEGNSPDSGGISP
ncbi:hypothetical protein HRbin15_01636 [bacterium HR15]|nr:hypothetical protein HRbin15_01636 [bacterium HR15]